LTDDELVADVEADVLDCFTGDDEDILKVIDAKALEEAGTLDDEDEVVRALDDSVDEAEVLAVEVVRLDVVKLEVSGDDADVEHVVDEEGIGAEAKTKSQQSNSITCIRL
jgi:hypothetical protein